MADNNSGDRLNYDTFRLVIPKNNLFSRITSTQETFAGREERKWDDGHHRFTRLSFPEQSTSGKA